MKPQDTEQTQRDSSRDQGQNLNRDSTLVSLGESRILRAFLPTITAHNAAVARRENTPSNEHSFERAGRLRIGPGDDCAVLNPTDRATVLTTDTLVQGQDFMSPWPAGISSTGYEVGWKATTQNLADIAAMGAEPVTLLVSLSMPEHTTYGWVEDFTRGIIASMSACGAHRCTVGGGDLGASRDITVTITAIGQMLDPSTTPVLRSGAKPGDTIALAGQTGWADAGLRLLLQPHTQLFGQGSWSIKSAVQQAVDAQLRPVCPVSAGAVAASVGATAMLDLSDGLLVDAARIAESSEIDMNLNPQAIEALTQPIIPAAQVIVSNQRTNRGADSYASLALDCVLGGGEDHGLLACFPSEVPLPKGFTPLGVCAKPARRTPSVLMNNRQVRTRRWEHYGAPAAE